MGMATSKVRLNICGSSYVVNTSESEDYMKNLADRLNLDMNELMASSNSVSITTAAVMTALNYRDELEKASGSADNMRRQIKDYLEDAASAKMAAEEARREKRRSNAVWMSWNAACAAISSRRRTNEPPRDFSPGGQPRNAWRRCFQRR